MITVFFTFPDKAIWYCGVETETVSSELYCDVILHLRHLLINDTFLTRLFIFHILVIKLIFCLYFSLG